MKRPTPASLKRVTPENLARLGAARLAEILAEVAETRVELKRRLRMELAAEQGADQLLPEIDRRLTALGTSRGAVSWRQRPAFVRDLDSLRGLIAERLATLEAEAARARILTFMGLAGRTQARARDREGAVPRVFERAASDVGRLFRDASPEEAGAQLAASIAEAPADWSGWLPEVLAAGGPGLAAAILRRLPSGSGPGWNATIRRLADAAGDVDRFRATFPPDALKTPSVAAEVATRYLQAGHLEPARAVLEAAVRPGLFRRTRSGDAAPDFAWETAWIDYLERSGEAAAAQEARWASFERTLAPERAKAFVARLPDFEDVEAEHRIFAMAATHADALRGLDLLMAWPALPEAAAMIAARAGELRPDADRAEAWAARLRRRHPAAAHSLLRLAAAEALRRREFATCNRLAREAEGLAID